MHYCRSIINIAYNRERPVSTKEVRESAVTTRGGCDLSDVTQMEFTIGPNDANVKQHRRRLYGDICVGRNSNRSDARRSCP